MSLDKEKYCELIVEKNINRKPSWLMNVLIAIDQLGNAIAGGNPDSTISARIGYFMHNINGNPNWYWRTLESIVDFTFKPIDGIKHCFIAYCNDKDEYFKDVRFLSKIALFLFVVLTCIPFLLIVIYVISLVYPKVKNDYSINGEKINLDEINTIRENYCNTQ